MLSPCRSEITTVSRPNGIQMTEEQFKDIRFHLQIIIGVLGAILGVVIGIAWNMP
jgi:hypothetical protein